MLPTVHSAVLHTFCWLTIFAMCFVHEIFYASLKLEFFFVVQIICFISSKCVIINLKLLKNKICKNSPNLTHYLTTKNFCNLLKFETKTRFSNCQKLHPIFIRTPDRSFPSWPAQGTAQTPHHSALHH